MSVQIYLPIFYWITCSFDLEFSEHPGDQPLSDEQLQSCPPPGLALHRSAALLRGRLTGCPPIDHALPLCPELLGSCLEGVAVPFPLVVSKSSFSRSSLMRLELGGPRARYQGPLSVCHLWIRLPQHHLWESRLLFSVCSWRLVERQMAEDAWVYSWVLILLRVCVCFDANTGLSLLLST